MTMIVLDKSFLQGHTADWLRETLRPHGVILSAELLYELVTDSQQIPVFSFFSKLRNLTVYQTHPILNLVHHELRTQVPAHIVDMVSTQQLRDALCSMPGRTIRGGVDEATRSFFEIEEPQRLRDGLTRMWDNRFDSIFGHARQSRDAGASALELYIELVDPLVGSELTRAHDMDREPGPGWVIYEWERLRNFLAFRYRLHGNRSDMLCDETLAHTLLDLHYAALLADADGLATCDNELACIARAFSPGKLILGAPDSNSRERAAS